MAFSTLSVERARTARRARIRASMVSSCQTMMQLEQHVAQLKQKLTQESLDEIIVETQTMIADCLENAGIDLAPLDRELVDVAHRFHSRLEIVEDACRCHSSHVNEAIGINHVGDHA